MHPLCWMNVVAVTIITIVVIVVVIVVALMFVVIVVVAVEEGNVSIGYKCFYGSGHSKRWPMHNRYKCTQVHTLIHTLPLSNFNFNLQYFI